LLLLVGQRSAGVFCFLLAGLAGGLVLLVGVGCLWAGETMGWRLWGLVGLVWSLWAVKTLVLLGFCLSAKNFWKNGQMVVVGLYFDDDFDDYSFCRTHIVANCKRSLKTQTG
jgi:hypothetical protein